MFDRSPPPPQVHSLRPGMTFPWFLVLCLVGLDYFSSLAYLPSIALIQTGALAPFAGVGVVALTLGAALPVYFYVVGRSPHGHGALGLLESRTRGWTGKVLILLLLGFVGTDFVITRTLSTSDAATHLLANPLWAQNAQQVAAQREAIRASLPAVLQGRFFDFWNQQILLTVGLAIAGFGLYFYLVRGMSKGFLRLAVGVTVLYLLLTGVIVLSGLVYLASNPDVVASWKESLHEEWQVGSLTSGGEWAWLLILAMLSFPPMALGLSGFELSMASAPLVQGRPEDDPAVPRGRIFRARVMLVCAALIMSVFVLGSVVVVGLLVPPSSVRIKEKVEVVRDGKAEVIERERYEHRALAYLAHGEEMTDKRLAREMNPIFSTYFGTLYDLSTVLILCLAGASATVGLREMVPDHPSRFGMQLVWAHKVGIIVHLFNVTILIVVVAFQASVTAQQGAYATSVLALLVGASLAAALDFKARWGGSGLGLLAALPFFLVAVVFLMMGLLTVVQQPVGVLIALLFVAVVFTTAFVSRWLRSTELRVEGFDFADEPSRQRWETLLQDDFQVLVAHQPGHWTLEEKELQCRTRHRLTPEVPILFVEVLLGDPSDFYQKPVIHIESVEGREVIRVSRCTSVAHVLAAVALAFSRVGQPPEIHFEWSDESPHTATLSFLLLGHGNVPWMVRELIRKAEPDVERRPRVVIA